MQIVFKNATTYNYSVFNYPFYFDLTSVSKHYDKTQMQTDDKTVVELVRPTLFDDPQKTFAECLLRKIDLCSNEEYSKKVVLWHQNTWETLKKADNQLLKSDFYLYVPLRFHVEMEDVGMLTTSAAPSVTLDRKKILSLRTLQKRLEEQTPGSTQRPKIVKPRPLGTPIFRSSLALDTKTGVLTASLFHDVPDPSTASAVRVNLDESFGYMNDTENFFSRFTAKSESVEEISVPKDATEPPTPGENRIFDLEDNESVGKECKIWEIAIWPQLVEAMKANRNEKFTISYPVSVELIGKFDEVPLNDEGFSIVKHEETAEMTIDYRTMTQMEKLREATE